MILSSDEYDLGTSHLLSGGGTLRGGGRGVRIFFKSTGGPNINNNPWSREGRGVGHIFC